MSKLSGDMIRKSINEFKNCVCEEFVEISRQIAEHAGDMVKGERESAFMFEIN